jgi:hypothetical protein
MSPLTKPCEITLARGGKKYRLTHMHHKERFKVKLVFLITEKSTFSVSFLNETDITK